VGSGAKQRTTVAKLNREAKLRRRREEKAERKAARKLAAADDSQRDAVPDSGEPDPAAEDADRSAAA
jgi:hypothetical protein